MTAEILIPVAVAFLLLALLLPLMFRRKPRRSQRLVSASLESVSAPTPHVEPLAVAKTKATQAPAPKKPNPVRRSPAAVTTPKITVAALVPPKAPQPSPAPAITEIAESPTDPDETHAAVFLPTLEPRPEVATAARAVERSQSRSPKFVVKTVLKSEAPFRKVPPPAAAPAAPDTGDKDMPASDKVVDITTAIQIRAPKKPQPPRHHLPAEIRAGLAKLHQKIDRLEDAVLDLEKQLRGFDLDFSKAPEKPLRKPERTVSPERSDENTIAA